MKRLTTIIALGACIAMGCPASASAQDDQAAAQKAIAAKRAEAAARRAAAKKAYHDKLMRERGNAARQAAINAKSDADRNIIAAERAKREAEKRKAEAKKNADN